MAKRWQLLLLSSQSLHLPLKLLILHSLISNALSDIIDLSTIWNDWLRSINFANMEIALTVCVFSRCQMESRQSNLISLFLLSLIDTSSIIRLVLWDSVFLVCSSRRSVASLWALCRETLNDLLVDLFNLLKCLSVGLFFIGKVFYTIIEWVFKFTHSIRWFAWESCGSVGLSLIDSSGCWLSGCGLIGFSLIRFGVTVVRAHVN